MQANRSAQDARMPGARISVRGVVFDYGNVLCLPQQPSDLESMAAICGMTLQRFQQLYWTFRLRYDRGELDGTSYWTVVAHEESKVLSPEQIAKLVILDSKGWSRPNQATIAWVDQLRGAGLRLGILSNMPPEISRYLLAHCDWLARFDSLTFSCDVGSVKPEPAIYEICLKDMKLAPDEVLFLDDIAVNVDGASAAGMHSLIFDTIEQTVARIENNFDLPLPALK